MTNSNQQLDDLEQFKQWLKQDEDFATLMIMHGERLFIRDNGEFKVLTIRLAYRAWKANHVVTPIFEA